MTFSAVEARRLLAAVADLVQRADIEAELAAQAAPAATQPGG
ncbi:hypothetical protein [Sphingomonas tagetis]|jgi:hypothetical protein|nr:hypothetical protein [Sphingomonas tagetis]